MRQHKRLFLEAVSIVEWELCGFTHKDEVWPYKTEVRVGPQAAMLFWVCCSEAFSTCSNNWPLWRPTPNVFKVRVRPHGESRFFADVCLFPFLRKSFFEGSCSAG